ncbi:MAG TPA: hypothetical protein VEM14_09990 [Gemmatimonadaceae bacterium]|nr:hypothetical protein [Gemmatimonadaceae bacterium]
MAAWLFPRSSLEVIQKKGVQSWRSATQSKWKRPEVKKTPRALPKPLARAERTSAMAAKGEPAPEMGMATVPPDGELTTK